MAFGIPAGVSASPIILIGDFHYNNGTYLGPKPSPPSDRYQHLNVIFSDSWRISDATSLFDYAPGTSTATFMLRGWPYENARSCEIPDMPAVEPIDLAVAQWECRNIIDKENQQNCVMDVAVTGEIKFAKTYLLEQQLEQGCTKTKVFPIKIVAFAGNPITIVAVINSCQRLLSDIVAKSFARFSSTSTVNPLAHRCGWTVLVEHNGPAINSRPENIGSAPSSYRPKAMSVI